MDEMKPLTDEELEVVRAVHKPGCSVEFIIEMGECRTCRFIATIDKLNTTIEKREEQIFDMGGIVHPDPKEE